MLPNLSLDFHEGDKSIQSHFKKHCHGGFKFEFSICGSLLLSAQPAATGLGSNCIGRLEMSLVLLMRDCQPKTPPSSPTLGRPSTWKCSSLLESLRKPVKMKRNQIGTPGRSPKVTSDMRVDVKSCNCQPFFLFFMAQQSCWTESVKERVNERRTNVDEQVERVQRRRKNDLRTPRSSTRNHQDTHTLRKQQLTSVEQSN
jgi:hypothetical protein